MQGVDSNSYFGNKEISAQRDLRPCLSPLGSARASVRLTAEPVPFSHPATVQVLRLRIETYGVLLSPIP